MAKTRTCCGFNQCNKEWRHTSYYVGAHFFKYPPSKLPSLMFVTEAIEWTARPFLAILTSMWLPNSVKNSELKGQLHCWKLRWWGNRKIKCQLTKSEETGTKGKCVGSLSLNLYRAKQRTVLKIWFYFSNCVFFFARLNFLTLSEIIFLRHAWYKKVIKINERNRIQVICVRVFCITENNIEVVKAEENWVTTGESINLKLLLIISDCLFF